MKNTIFLAIIALNISAVFAQQKLTPATYQRALQAVRFAESKKNIDPALQHTDATASPDIVSVFISVNEGYTAEDLRKIDYISVGLVIDNMAICDVDAERLMDLEKEVCIKRVEIGQKLEPQMDYARPSGQVDDAQKGFTFEGETRSFDGTGVICGMMDTGLDANHINFKNDDGTSRIKRLWHMTGSNGASTMYTDETISNFTTDGPETHATHVGGIIGGGYKGNGKYYYVADPSGSRGEMKENTPIPYYGVSTGADLAFAVGQLYTPNIVKGVENIITYAESVGRPAVINLSLGHTTGPHDGTDSYSSALSSLGKRAIVCMSAGNDGDANISVSKNITATSGNNSMLQTFVLSGGSTSAITGVVDLWGTDNTVLTVEWGIYDTSNASFTPFITMNTENSTKNSSSSTEFVQNFTGSVEATSYIDTNNNRYNCYTSFNGVNPTGTNKAIALRVSGAKVNQTIYVYSSTQNLVFSNKPSASGSIPVGFSNGSASNSINDGCCAENIISVGSYNTRKTWGRLDSQVYGYNASAYNVGSISPFSSYGTSFQGTALPHVTAPGCGIVSSISSYYVTGSTSLTMTAVVTSGGRNYYWGNMQGTSMSCPFVTGVIGLWLQAYPAMDYAKVMDIIQKTSFYNALTMRGGRWGYGQIRAVDGLKEALTQAAAGLGNVWADDEQRLVVTPTGNGLEVFLAGEEQLTATLYDLQGRPVAKAEGADGSATVATTSLPHGLYILEARTPSTRLSKKMTL